MPPVQSLEDWLRSVDGWLSRHTWYRMVRNSVLGLNRRDGRRKAAAMTYFAIFSIFPFLLLLISLLSFFIDSRSAQEQVIGLLSEFLPAGATGIQGIIEGVVAARGVAAGFGIVLLLWGALGWFQAIDRGVNEMWVSSGTRSFLKGKLFALAMIAAIGFVMLLSWAANIAVGILMSFATSIIGGSAVLWDSAVWGLTVVLMFIVFLLLYRFSPMCDLTWGDVWRGALVTAVIWSVLRSAFAIYVIQYADYSSLYGPIGAVIVFLLWLYLAHIVILFGAALTYVTRLESQGVHELQDLPCGAAREGAAEAGRRQAGTLS